MSGMTGTAKTEEDEFKEIYGVGVLVIPTNKPILRDDQNDVVYRSELGKYNAVVNEIERVAESGQPILVGTVTIEASEKLSKMLTKRKVTHKVLNAKHHEKEAEIVAQAGRSNAVTISTNMAGRGTDIVLGGNPEMMMRQSLESQGVERYDRETELFIKSIMLGRSDEARALARDIPELPADIIPQLEKIRDEAKQDQQKVLDLGGLYIIGTERHESRRIDNQLRGRAGRQGDVGASRFFVSFDDDLMRLFANERVLGMMDSLGMDDETPIDNNMVTGAIERAQKRVEDRNFGIRKQLLEFDNVMSKQREVIYAQRREILLGGNIKDDVLDMIAEYTDAQVQSTLNPELEFEEIDISSMRTALVEAVPTLESFDFESLRELEADEATDELVPLIEAAYEAREEELGTELMRELERYIVLQVVDQHWKEHLHSMDVLKQGIGLRGYGQRNPIQEYGSEGFILFNEMKDSIRLDAARLLFRVQVNNEQNLQREQRSTSQDNYGSASDVQGASAMRQAQAQQRGRSGPQALNRKQRRQMEKRNKGRA